MSWTVCACPIVRCRSRLAASADDKRIIHHPLVKRSLFQENIVYPYGPIHPSLARNASFAWHTITAYHNDTTYLMACGRKYTARYIHIPDWTERFIEATLACQKCLDTWEQYGRAHWEQPL